KVLATDVPPEVRDRIIENLKLFLPGKWRELRKSPELSRAIVHLLGRSDTDVAALNLIGAAEWVDFDGDAFRLALPNYAPETRRAAVQTLGMLPTEKAVELLETARKTDGLFHVEIIRALGRHARQKSDWPGAAPALKVLQQLVADPKLDGDERQAAAEALAGSRPGTVWLLEQEAKKQLPETLRPAVARLLRNSPHQDLRNRAMLAFPAPGKLDPKKLPSLASLASRRGD